MPRRLRMLGVEFRCVLYIALALGRFVAADDVDGATHRSQFFDQQVLPILAEHCFQCHGGEPKIRGGLKLTNLSSIVSGGDTGPAVDSENPAESLLLAAIRYESLEMPPSGKLSDEQIDILTKWVRSGTPWSETTKDYGVETEPDQSGPPSVNDEARQFWSYQKVRRPKVPSVADNGWGRNPVDAFVFEKLNQQQLSPNAEADRRVLIRRAFYDLTGLPPTPEQVASFLADTREDAYEKLVDELLGSPRYGERWGRHWLDLVRYAETNSFERDGVKPHIWRYRDYVINSLNADKPYNQFILEQIAGDELQPTTPDAYIATGYYRLGQWDDEPTDQAQSDFDSLDDVLATTAQVFLGMTINCARCHDHKIDPIPQSDYYQMLAFVRGIKPYGHRGLDSGNLMSFDRETGERIDPRIANGLEDEKSAVSQQLHQLEERVRSRLTNPEKEDFEFEGNRVSMLRARIPELLSQEEFDQYEAAWQQLHDVTSRSDALSARIVTAIGVSEGGSEPPATHILIRGSAHAEGDLVEPGFPSVLGFPPPETIAPRGNSSGRRLALAKWIASDANPLTARVIVNRLWQHHFDRGIVDTPSDFGFQGSRPSHHELLDWLASELTEGGWRLKRIHRVLMTSSTYRMSSAANEPGLRVDAENRLLWRMNMRRLSAEEIRDSILAVNGSLNLQQGGPSVFPPVSESVLAGQSRPGSGWDESDPQEAARRSIYIHVKRSLITPILASFDFADTDFSCPVRFATTQPTQALGFINGDFINEQAARFAGRLRDETSLDVRQQVARALRLTFSREPNADEIDRGLNFFSDLMSQDHATADTALHQFCLLVLNLNEFIYLD